MEIKSEELLKKAEEKAKNDLENPNYYGTCPQKDITGDSSKSNRPLHLFTASAGSGKTWRLAFEYICLLLKDAVLPAEGKNVECIPDNYRHILAITFTNKATAEMKERILANLEMLSNDDLDGKKADERMGYLQQLANRLDVSVENVVARARFVYSNLLHDYSHFHIQTIDSFFQSVLRNLAQELGIGSYWDVELDSESVLKDAAHRMLNKVRDNAKLRKCVSDYVKDRIDDNKNWNIEGELVSFGSNLFSEALITNDEMDDFLEDDPQNPKLYERISLIKQAMAVARATCQKRIKDEATQFINFCAANGMLPEHFSFSHAIYNYVQTLANGETKEVGKTVPKFLNATTPDEMVKVAFVKAHQSTHLNNVVALQACLANVVNVFNEANGQIIVFNQVLKNINQIGLLADIKREVSALQEENNIFMLAYAQPLLHKFITNDDAPFVFERIGESLRYMMIDEFQDTSKVQFQNFRPLIQNCCASNTGSLIVGDAKQAIYRFRNGDWTLIESLRKQSDDGVENDERMSMPTPIHGHNMQFNYRSSENVVNFNNAMFRTDFSDETNDFYQVPLKRSIVSILDAANNGHTEYLKNVYSTSHQFAKEKSPGYVKVKFHLTDKEEKEEETPWQLQALLAEIEDLHKNGVKYSDMTILSRFNKDIPKIAAFLTQNGVPIVSDLAFLLSASIKVRLIIDALRYVDAYISKSSAHPKDELYKKELSCDYLRYLNANNPDFTDFNADEPKVEGWCARLRGDVDVDGENTGRGDLLPSLPIYDMAEEIYHMIFVDEPTDEYVQAFFDYLRDFLARRVASIRDVISYWDDKLSGVSIPADPKKADGVKMLSIHKSKGLESHTILLANCSWKVTADKKTSFWCSGKGKLGDEMADFEIPMMPVDFTSKLQDTAFSDEYWEEMAQLHAENVNLFYVALTRAKHNLIVIDEYVEKTDDKLVEATMGTLLHAVFDETDLQDDDVVPKPVSDEADSNTVKVDKCYMLGEIFPSDVAKKKEEVVGDLVNQRDSYPIRGHFRQSSAANSFVINKAIVDNSKADFGIQMHCLLSYIDHFTDESLQFEVNKAVNRLVLEGVLPNDDADVFVEKAVSYFSNLSSEYPDLFHDWFGDHLKVLNESNIILYDEWTSKKLEEKRPDRLVYDAKTNTFTVIDYKTGNYSPEAHKCHVEQVRTYMRLVSQLCPNANVKGFVWYLSSCKVKSVD